MCRTAKEPYADIGYAYEKCKLCGSFVFRGAGVRQAVAAGAETVEADQGARHDLLGTVIIEKNERKKSAREYAKRLSEKGCGGVCIQYDTKSCGGGKCKGCAVSKAGLCCKRYLVDNDNSIILERDGGDYRNLMGDFTRRLTSESGYDAEIRKKLSIESAKADAFRGEVRKQVVGTEDSSLVFEWREYTLDDLLVMFPHNDRRPVRIEIQLLIYLYMNYRFPIDLDHAEARFQIPKFVINRYLRSYFGYSYSSLLSKIRNEHSKKLLRIPLLRVGEIGALVGYKSHYHYTLNFKRYEGVSPTEYRESVVGAGSVPGGGA